MKDIAPLKNNFNLEITVPADKSISHRAILLASLANNTSKIYNFLDSKDTIASYKAMEVLGTKFEISKSNIKVIPKKQFFSDQILDCKNSGTTARLLTGIVSSKNINGTILGDVSLSNRPMKRIITPLKLMGANIECISKKDHLPLKICKSNLSSIEYELPIKSAQLKSSILFAGLNATGKTKILSPGKTRNHTELLFKKCLLDIKYNNNCITLNPGIPKNFNLFVPGDISSAYYFIVLCILSKNSSLKITDVGLNETRMGFFRLLKKMGANLEYEITDNSLEPYGNIYCQSSKLKSIVLDNIVEIIDEVPLLAICSIFAEGITTIKNTNELKYKESNRIKSLVSNFLKLNLKIDYIDENIIIPGNQKINYGIVNTFFDHRIEMAFSILGALSSGGLKIKNENFVNISFPDFFCLLNKFYGDKNE